MGDLAFVGLTLVFFGLSWALVGSATACSGGTAMGLYVLGGIVAVGLFVYLLVAMLKPEAFS